MNHVTAVSGKGGLSSSVLMEMVMECVYTPVIVCVHACVCVCACVHLHCVCMWIDVYTMACTCIYNHVCVYVCVCALYIVIFPVDGAIAKLGQEAAANAKWIVNFTKPCPNCKSVFTA